MVGAIVLSALCAGFGVLALLTDVEPKVERAKARRESETKERDRIDDAKALLALLADRLLVVSMRAGELPEMLDEAPPKDPWGHPVRYERRSPDHAELRSAGADGELGTRDDVHHDVQR